MCSTENYENQNFTNMSNVFKMSSPMQAKICTVNVDTAFLMLQLENYLRNCKCDGSFLFGFICLGPPDSFCMIPFAEINIIHFYRDCLLTQEITFISREKTYSLWRKTKLLFFLCNTVDEYWNMYKNKHMCWCMQVLSYKKHWKIIKLITLTKWIIMNMLWK